MSPDHGDKTQNRVQLFVFFEYLAASDNAHTLHRCCLFQTKHKQYCHSLLSPQSKQIVTVSSMTSKQLGQYDTRLGIQNRSSIYKNRHDYESAEPRRTPLVKFAPESGCTNDADSKCEPGIQLNQRDNLKKTDMSRPLHYQLDEFVAPSMSFPNYASAKFASSSHNTRKSAIKDVIKQFQCSNYDSKLSTKVICQPMQTSPEFSSTSSSSAFESIGTKSFRHSKSSSSNKQSPLQKLFQLPIQNCMDQCKNEAPTVSLNSTYRCNSVGSGEVDILETDDDSFNASSSFSKKDLENVFRCSTLCNNSSAIVPNKTPSPSSDNETYEHYEAKKSFSSMRRSARKSQKSPHHLSYSNDSGNPTLSREKTIKSVKDSGVYNLISPTGDSNTLNGKGDPSTGHTACTEVSTPWSDNAALQPNSIPFTYTSDSLQSVRMKLFQKKDVQKGIRYVNNDTGRKDDYITNKAFNLQQEEVRLNGYRSTHNDRTEDCMSFYAEVLQHESHNLSTKVEIVSLKSKVSSLEQQLKLELQAHEMDKERFIKDEARLKAQIHNLMTSLAKGKTSAQYTALEAKLEIQMNDNHLLQERLDESEHYIRTLERNIEDNLKSWEQEEESFRKEISENVALIKVYEETNTSAKDLITKVENDLSETKKELSKLLDSVQHPFDRKNNDTDGNGYCKESSKQLLEMANLLRIENNALHAEIDIVKKSLEAASKKSSIYESLEAERSRLKEELNSMSCKMELMEDPERETELPNNISNSSRCHEMPFKFDEFILLEEVNGLQKAVDVCKSQIAEETAEETKEINDYKKGITKLFQVRLRHCSTGGVEIKLGEEGDSMISSFSEDELITSLEIIDKKNTTFGALIESYDVVMEARSCLNECDQSESDDKSQDSPYQSTGSNHSPHDYQLLHVSDASFNKDLSREKRDNGSVCVSLYNEPIDKGRKSNFYR